jgi:hypothetical protein
VRPLRDVTSDIADEVRRRWLIGRGAGVNSAIFGARPHLTIIVTVKTLTDAAPCSFGIEIQIVAPSEYQT